MTSETMINFCFIRARAGNFSKEIDQLLQDAFKGMDFTWQLKEKEAEEAELVIAKLSGRSKWILEEEAVYFMEQHADGTFWDYLQAFQITNYPAKRGCDLCESH